MKANPAWPFVTLRGSTQGLTENSQSKAYRALQWTSWKRRATSGLTTRRPAPALFASRIRSDVQLPLNGPLGRRVLMVVLRREGIVFVRRDLFFTSNALIDAGYGDVSAWRVALSPMFTSSITFGQRARFDIPRHVYLLLCWQPHRAPI